MDGEAARRKLRLRLVLARLGPEHLGGRKLDMAQESRAGSMPVSCMTPSP
jgi:hypothetical protein